MTKKKKEPHPTLFCLEGSIRVYEGSMLELHGQITQAEWNCICEETVAYKIFVQALKDVAIPILEESWSEEDEWFRLQLGVAVSRMRNIDPILIGSIDQREIKKSYEDKMRRNAKETAEFVKSVRRHHKAQLEEQLSQSRRTEVSNL